MSQPLTQRQIEHEVQKRKVSKLFQVAIKYGVIHFGFSAIDYLRYAIKNYGWESTAIVGPKGSAKSNLLLQRGYAILKNWDLVIKYTVTKRKQFLNLLQEAIDKEERIPWLGVDDIATLFPKSLYFTHRKMYSTLQASWETLRTVMNCFDFTCTRKNKVATFILEDITGDIMCYNRQGDLKSHYDYRRWLWLRNLKDPTEMVAKLISIEDIPFPLIPEAFGIDTSLREGNYVAGGETYKGEDFYKNHACLTGMPREQFLLYWNTRLGLAKDAYGQFSRILEEPEPKQKKLQEPKEPKPPPSPEMSALAKQLAERRWHKPASG